MLLANILFLILGYFAVPLFARIVTIRKSILLPVITIFAFAGSYVFRSDPFDLKVLVFFGALGYAARKLQFDVSPMVMAFILGPILEYSFGQTVNLAGGNLLHYMFIDRPFAAAIFMLIPVFSVLFSVKAVRRRRKARTQNSPMKGGEV
jgi:putative tricarboxylic transport membrane protein